tara:strand:- start:659 stop:1069 length:411 start_codon:yes stop_codon:yes gene_type:complete
MIEKSKLMDSLSKNLPQDRKHVEVTSDVKDDYEYSREKYKGLLDRGEEALMGMLQLASESEHPRAYEVLSGMMKNMADITDKLMDLQKKTKELTKAEEKEKPATLTQNNVFVGSTTDLQRMLLKGTEDYIDVDTDK